MTFEYTNSRGRTYFLHAKTAILGDGQAHTIYYFRKNVTDESLENIPKGFVLRESKNGLPVIVRGK